MTTPVRDSGPSRVPIPMTPDRWRAVDAILQAALACPMDRRDAFVLDACAEDHALRREVESLLAAHDAATAGFLERPAAEVLGTSPNSDAPPAALADALADALGGRYLIEREIARGGMATVYLARDVRHDRRVAIKVLRDAVAAAVGAERFLAEIRVTASLQHPHILPLFDSGSGAGLLWYVMPFVEGETLRSRIAREGQLPVAEAVRLAREIAAALDYAHARGIVHRDIKPENVLLQPAPGSLATLGMAVGGHVLVADFGIALAIEQAGGERLTRTGLTLGTPQYMAPEQAAGERVLDARVDVYALGAVLHEMLAGEPPFAAGSRPAVVRRMLHDPPTALATRRDDVPPGLDAAVRRALEKQPALRFPSASAFATALAAALVGPPDQGDGARERVRTAAPEAGRMVGARTAMYAAVVTLALGLVGGWAVARWASGAPTVAPAVVATVQQRAAAVAAGQPSVIPGELALAVVDRAGQPIREIATTRPWTPRFSPDGRRVAYGAYGDGRESSDLWVTDLAAGTTRRLTDDDADSNDPQWSPDGSTLAYSVSGPGGKDLSTRRLQGREGRTLAARDGTQFPSDWLRDGSALLVTDESGGSGHDVVVQPADGSAPRPYAATAADESAARLSPDGRWVAYTSDASGRPEVYLDAYPRPGRRILVSRNGGVHPVWRGDGRELYYWRDGALIAVSLGASSIGAPPTLGAQTVLFRAAYEIGPNTMYDASPDGARFVLVRRR